MTLLQYIGSLYSLDTLDARFTTTSKENSRHDVPSASANSANLQNTKPRPSTQELAARGAKPAKWRTPEFMVYAVVFALVVPLMFKTVYDVSQPSHPGYSRFEHLLSPGWVPGRKVDDSDHQYSGFRENVPYLLVVLLLHPILRRAFDHLFGESPNGQPEKTSRSYANGSLSPYGGQVTAADRRLDARIKFDVGFGFLFLVALHGFSILKVLIILYLNFMIAKKSKRDYVPAATWIFNICILFANELGKGYHYEDIARVIFPFAADHTEPNWGVYLDKYGGLIPRWEVLFNVTVLRLISFNLDFYWSFGRAGGSPIEKQLDPSNLSERDRVGIPARDQDYSFRNYFAYVLYSPLYLAGPILTFNDYISQQRYMPQSISSNRTLLYGIRFLIALLCMELMIHFIYVVAISKAEPDWSLYSPFQLSMLGYFNLHHIWLKLLLPWRFFRLWALVDGIDPPENIVRCMSDNYSTFAFWRGWHRSFNRWIIRYIYIPMGGSGSGGGSATSRPRSSILSSLRSIANLLVVFTFVALWHDIQLRVLIWGWLITLFVLPELIASYLFPASKWKDRPETYRVICGIGAVGNIMMMMAANLVGFALGIDGLKGLVVGIAGSYAGLIFLLTACAALFTGVQVMFEWRQQELRQGISMKC